MQQPNATIKHTDPIYDVITEPSEVRGRALRPETEECLYDKKIAVSEEGFLVAGYLVEYYLDNVELALFGQQNAVDTLVAALNACAASMTGDIPAAGGKHRKSRKGRKTRKGGRKGRASRASRASRKQTKRR
jgi:hypothetical protein